MAVKKAVRKAVTKTVKKTVKKPDAEKRDEGEHPETVRAVAERHVQGTEVCGR